MHYSRFLAERKAFHRRRQIDSSCAPRSRVVATHSTCPLHFRFLHPLDSSSHPDGRRSRTFKRLYGLPRESLDLTARATPPWSHYPRNIPDMSSSTATPPENDIADAVAPLQNGPRSPTFDRATREPADNSSVPKPKRLACMICRRRKLKCDGVRPSCSTCSRLGHSCAYDEVRRKSGPKRGYVKALEERLSRMPTRLLRHAKY